MRARARLPILKTVAPVLLALCGYGLAAPANQAITTPRPLTVHPTNPRYFTDGSGRAVYLTGSHTWNNLQHNGVYPPVDFKEYLDFLRKHNHNFIRMWAWEQAGWDPWAKGYVTVEPVAFARTGPGKALDGKPKFDLTKLNDEYFRRLRTRVAAAQARGIYVSIMLFEGWSVERKGQVGNPWQGHPFNKANNINGIDGDRDGDGQGPEIHTVNAPKEILAFQCAYVRRVSDTVTVIPSLHMVIAVRGAKLGPFKPGKPNGAANQNLRLLINALPTAPPYPPSGVMQVAAYEAVNVEVLARLAH